MNSETKLTLRQDRTLLRSTIWRLTARQKLFCAAGVLAAALIWYGLADRLLGFGLSLDYTGLQAFGPQATALLKQYGPFFWWALVIALTLIIAYFLYGLVQTAQRAMKLRLVGADTVQLLAQQLSAEGRDVLLWVWHDRREPLRIGDLKRAYDELGAGRYEKIVLAKAQAALLTTVVNPLTGSPTAASQDTAVLQAARQEPILRN